MKTFFLVFLFFINLSSFAQHEEMKILWEEGLKLDWSDFQGRPDSKNPFSANTNSGISFSWSLKTSGGDQEFIYEVQNSFYPERSWVKGKEPSAHLLAHEQLHFDISELHARKLRRELANYELTPNAKKELNAIYQRNERERAEMQKQFDRESNHSMNLEAEAAWQDSINAELQKLKKFSSEGSSG